MIDYIICDIVFVDYGCKELDIVEIEMFGLMVLCVEYGEVQFLKGVCIVGLLYMIIQIGVLIEMLVVLGVEVCWVLCNIFLIQDYVVVVIVQVGILVFVIKGEILLEYWFYIDQIFQFFEGMVNMILDDGGDVSMYILLGVWVEVGEIDLILIFISEEEEVLFVQICKCFVVSFGWFIQQCNVIKGVFEEIIIGVYCLYDLYKKGLLFFLVINVNDSVIKLKFDNKYGCKELLVDGICCVIDVMMVGKVVVVCGYGDVGKGFVVLFSGVGVCVKVIEVDLICVL